MCYSHHLKLTTSAGHNFKMNSVLVSNQPCLLCDWFFYPVPYFPFLSLARPPLICLKKATKSTLTLWKPSVALKEWWPNKLSSMVKVLIEGIVLSGQKFPVLSKGGMDWGHGIKVSPSVQRCAWTRVQERDSSWLGENLLKAGHVIALWGVTDHIVIKRYC